MTRATEDAAAFAPSLARLGFDPVLVPLIERSWKLSAVMEAAEQDPDVDVVFVTSGSTAQVLAAGAPSAWRQARWAAVGPSTAGRLRAMGLPCHLIAPRATAADLVAALGDVSGLRVLYPKADLADPHTSDELRARGAEVIDVIAYENRPPDGAIQRLAHVLPVDATVVMSGSAVQRIAAALPPARWPELGALVCIGPSTAGVAQRLGLRVSRVASPHTAMGVLEALAQMFPPPLTD